MKHIRLLWAPLATVLVGCSDAPSGPPVTDPDGGGPCQRAPRGQLEEAGAGLLSGWARDDDAPAAELLVQVFIDGVPVQQLATQGGRFLWRMEGLGPGPASAPVLDAHRINVYVNGVDCAGGADGMNREIAGSPAYLAEGCARLAGGAGGFCTEADYWRGRQATTTLFSAPGVQVGVARAFGGAVLQLRGAGQAADGTGARFGANVLYEHGEGGIQLGLRGRGAVGGVADPNYTYEGATRPCEPLLDKNPPGHVLQAQGPECQWGDLLGLVHGTDIACWVADGQARTCRDFGNTYYTRYESPFHRTRAPAPVYGLRLDQWIQVAPGRVIVGHDLRYPAGGAQEWLTDAQEVPRIAVASGGATRFYSYTGARPFTGDPVGPALGPLLPGTQVVLRLPGRARYPHASFAAVAQEGWWGACDEAERRCLTVAGFDADLAEAVLSQDAQSATLSAVAGFALAPGLSRRGEVVVFPYRFDQPIPEAGGQTPRQLVYGLAQARRAPEQQ